MKTPRKQRSDISVVLLRQRERRALLGSRSAEGKDYYQRNKAKVLANQKARRITHPPKPRDRRRCEYGRARYLRLKHALEVGGKVFRAKRPKAKTEEERRKRKNEMAIRYYRENRLSVNAHLVRRYHANALVRLVKCCRATMWRALRRMASGTGKTDTTFALIGCTTEELKQHIQNQFKPGMAWNNYGYRGWHVDHIRPLASFDLFDPAQQRQAFSYKNLQPLWDKENMRKGAKILA